MRFLVDAQIAAGRRRMLDAVGLQRPLPFAPVERRRLDVFALGTARTTASASSAFAAG
jgi:hypothetical protein